MGTKQSVAATVDVGDLSKLDSELSVFRGGIYTTAALFAEGIEEINQWAEAGWDAVDMETATTFAVAEYFGMDSASLLYVFDNPRLHGDIVLNEHEKDERRRWGHLAMTDWTFRMVEQYLSGEPHGC